MFETEALKALGSFPLVQAALAILIVIGGYLALVRGTRDKNGGGTQQPSSTIPSWLMMGPAHEAIRAIHEINERLRDISKTLEHIDNRAERIDGNAEALAKEQREQTQLLEDIRNNQVARGDILPPPTPPPRRKSL